MKQKIFYWFSMVTLAFTALFLVYVYFLAFIPRDIIRFNHPTYRVLTPVVKPGKHIVYLTDYCKFTDAVSSTQRNFVATPSGEITPLTATATNQPVGCHQSRVSILVPDHIASGSYYLDINLSYDVNALRKDVPYRTRTETFSVK